MGPNIINSETLPFYTFLSIHIGWCGKTFWCMTYPSQIKFLCECDELHISCHENIGGKGDMMWFHTVVNILPSRDGLHTWNLISTRHIPCLDSQLQIMNKYSENVWYRKALVSTCMYIKFEYCVTNLAFVWYYVTILIHDVKNWQSYLKYKILLLFAFVSRIFWHQIEKNGNTHILCSRA